VKSYEHSVIEVEVRGNCMRYLFREGESVFASDGIINTVFPGDIIVYKDGDGFVVHRVMLKWSKNGSPVFITRGDMCFLPDKPVTGDRVKGKVIFTGKMDLVSAQGKFVSYIICIYSMPALAIISFTDILMDIPPGIIGLLRRILGPGSEALNRLYGSVFALSYRTKKTVSSLLNVIPELISSLAAA